jgi:hypothetical protein
LSNAHVAKKRFGTKAGAEKKVPLSIFKEEESTVRMVTKAFWHFSRGNVSTKHLHDMPRSATLHAGELMSPVRSSTA